MSEISTLSHHWFFNVKLAEDFVLDNGFKIDEKDYLFGVTGGRFVPLKIRDFLVKLIPSLFACSQIWKLKI